MSNSSASSDAVSNDKAVLHVYILFYRRFKSFINLHQWTISSVLYLIMGATFFLILLTRLKTTKGIWKQFYKSVMNANSRRHWSAFGRIRGFGHRSLRTRSFAPPLNTTSVASGPNKKSCLSACLLLQKESIVVETDRSCGFLLGNGSLPTKRK